MMRAPKVLLVLLCVPSGCALGHSLLDIGVLNNCDVEVEAAANDVETASGDDLNWEVLPPGTSAYLGSTVENPDEVFVWIRPVGGDVRPEPLRVAGSDLTDPPDDAGYEAEVIISDERCPSP